MLSRQLLLLVLLFFVVALPDQASAFRLWTTVREQFGSLGEDRLCTIESNRRPINILIIGTPRPPALQLLDSLKSVDEYLVRVFLLPWHTDTVNLTAHPDWLLLSPLMLVDRHPPAICEYQFICFDQGGRILSLVRVSRDSLWTGLATYLLRSVGAATAAENIPPQRAADKRGIIGKYLSAAIGISEYAWRPLENHSNMINVLIVGASLPGALRELLSMPELSPELLSVFTFVRPEDIGAPDWPPNWFSLNEGCSASTHTPLRCIVFNRDYRILSVFTEGDFPQLRAFLKAQKRELQVLLNSRVRIE